MRKTVDREKLVMILRRRFQSMKNDIEEARMTGDTERVKLMTIRANEAYTILKSIKEDRLEYL